MKFSILLLVCLVGLASVSQASPDKTRIQQLKIDLKDKTLDQLRDEKAEVSGKWVFLCHFFFKFFIFAERSQEDKTCGKAWNQEGSRVRKKEHTKILRVKKNPFVFFFSKPNKAERKEINAEIKDLTIDIAGLEREITRQQREKQQVKKGRAWANQDKPLKSDSNNWLFDWK